MKQGMNVKSLVLLVMSALPGSAGILPAVSGGQDGIQKGVVIQSLPTQADPAQTYALFLPAEYGSRTKWPVLICFDPGARGYLPVECFRYIVAFDFLRPYQEFRQLVETVQANHQKAQ